MKNNKLVVLMILLLSLGVIVSCNDDDDPIPPGGGDDGEETITQVVLTFTPEGDGDVVTATWLDADGEGSGNPVIDKVNLLENTEYTLTMTLTNTLADPDEDITAEIRMEDDEHQFFFAFTDDIFSDPTGNGNVDNAADDINYGDQDDNGLPVGLTTTWTTGVHDETEGQFTVILKHQPGEKSATSTAATGGTDVTAIFPIEIVEEGNVEEEEINEVLLTFTPTTGGGDPVTATWLDADGEGAGAPVIDEIDLEEGITYDLAITLTNSLGATPEDVTAEIMTEDDEHQFFFEFTNNIFSDPLGDGNTDNRDDAINYNDTDENSLPVGLSTTWTAGGHTDAAGEFTVILKHQPGVKSGTSTVDDGGTDVDVTFPLNILEDPNEEEETITKVDLTFTPAGGGDDIVATWFDADGEGVGVPTIDEIDLVEGEEYTLAITLTNTLGMMDEDVTAEIAQEDDEHQFFFEFTNNIFSNPTGNGNIDNRDDPLNYADQDENGLPVGLSTTWTAGAHTDAAGEFRVVLKHQPGVKSGTSTADDGGTDINVTFPLNIVEPDANAEEEVINQVVLTFTPAGGGDAITATWFDADGEGVGNPTIDKIELDASTAYEMSITLTNTLETPEEDVTAEIQAEDNEHQFFFSFTADIFSDPAGNGNVDNASDALNYNDQDENGLPVGLSTNWTTGAATTSDGTFNVVLKHQPGLKTASSDATVGGTDVDIDFDISIQ